MKRTTSFAVTWVFVPSHDTYAMLTPHRQLAAERCEVREARAAAAHLRTALAGRERQLAAARSQGHAHASSSAPAHGLVAMLLEQHACALTWGADAHTSALQHSHDSGMHVGLDAHAGVDPAHAHAPFPAVKVLPAVGSH